MPCCKHTRTRTDGFFNKNSFKRILVKTLMKLSWQDFEFSRYIKNQLMRIIFFFFKTHCKSSQETTIYIIHNQRQPYTVHN